MTIRCLLKWEFLYKIGKTDEMILKITYFLTVIIGERKKEKKNAPFHSKINKQ